MPAEWEPHQGCIMIWPKRPGSWPYGARAAKQVFAEIAAEISCSEQVYMLVDPGLMEEARGYVQDTIESKRKQHDICIEFLPIETDDAWARDVGPTFVKNTSGEVYGIDWRFNAWGGKYDGLYANWKKDDAAAGAFCEEMGIPCYDAHDFVLEGGSIHTDGEGTLLVTEACLLSPGRNPQLTKEEIEQKLKEYLGVEKVIWLPHGIWQDETNEHVDNVCAFVRPGEVVLAWTDDASDPQYAYSRACLQVLKQETDAKGRKITVHRLPIPQKPVCITAEDLPGYEYEEGEAERVEGERLAASYVNFYIANGSVLVPQFGDENDAYAASLLAQLFPERRIVPIQARDIILGGGNIHCITQQIP